MNDDLHSLHEASNDALVRLLFFRVRGLCGSFGHISKTAESSTGRASVPADAPGQADAPADSGRDKEPILSMSMFASKADYDEAVLRLKGPIA